MHDQDPGWYSWAKFGVEFAFAAASAAVGTYVRLRRNPDPFSKERLVALMAEAVVCGFIAIGSSAVLHRFFDLDTERLATGIAAALGLVGTNVISDFLLQAARKGVKKIG